MGPMSSSVGIGPGGEGHSVSGRQRRFRWRYLLLVAGAAFSIVLCAHCDSTDGKGFVCGYAPSNDDSQTRLCNNPNEVCVCATGGCAVPETSCDGGLKYVGSPFAGDPSRTSTCVAAGDVGSARDQRVTNPRCDRDRDASTSSGTPDAGTSSGTTDAGVAIVDATAEGG